LKISLFKKKPFFTAEEQKQIVDAVREAETQTSGEIRVYVESHCRFVDAVDRAAEVFVGLNMQNTAERNAVLVYVAMKDRQMALFGDKGIHEKVGDVFWNENVRSILSHFNSKNYVGGLRLIVQEIGAALRDHFPYNKDTDKNELPDDMVFGR
jgi:uncharacterized membrane protein